MSYDDELATALENLLLKVLVGVNYDVDLALAHMGGENPVMRELFEVMKEAAENKH